VCVCVCVCVIRRQKVTNWRHTYFKFRRDHQPISRSCTFSSLQNSIKVIFEVTEKDGMKQGRGKGEVLADTRILVRKSETTCDFPCCMVNEKFMLK
jgi:hypothetical protein